MLYGFWFYLNYDGLSFTDSKADWASICLADANGHNFKQVEVLINTLVGIFSGCCTF